MFADSKVAAKFLSAETKTAAIIKGVLAPYSHQQLLKELSSLPYSLSIDASNHKETKLFPVVVRFFSPNDGIKVRLMELKDLPGESAGIVVQFITDVLQNNGLEFHNMVSFCADNAPVNFGGAQHNGKMNVFKKLKEKSKRLIPISCPAHILHNTAQKGADGLPFDIEAIVFKLHSHFKGSTQRHEQLKSVCELLEVEYSSIPTHGPTRWVTLKKVLLRIIELWTVLNEYFANLEKPPRLLQDFFASDEARCIVLFLESALACFDEPLKLLQKSNALLPELVTIVESFRAKINDRKSNDFYGAKTANALAKLNNVKRDYLSKNFDDFYICLYYVDKWFRLEKLPTDIAWIMLNSQQVQYNEVRALTEQIAPELAEKDDLFDEVVQLNQILTAIPNEKFIDKAPKKSGS